MDRRPPFLLTGVDTFFALAAVVADELYRAPLPLVALAAADFAQLATGMVAQVEPDGAITLEAAP
ncbi:MAG: hypothetical protein R2854_23610 [Caldilineaceae bacterium]